MNLSGSASVYVCNMYVCMYVCIYVCMYQLEIGCLLGKGQTISFLGEGYVFCEKKIVQQIMENK